MFFLFDCSSQVDTISTIFFISETDKDYIMSYSSQTIKMNKYGKILESKNVQQKSFTETKQS
jgi:hypothetical protein